MAGLFYVENTGILSGKQPANAIPDRDITHRQHYEHYDPANDLQ